jgi:phage terminase large subunit
MRVPLTPEARDCYARIAQRLTVAQRRHLATRHGKGHDIAPDLFAFEAELTARDDPTRRHPDWAACAADPVYWMDRYAKTYNPHLLATNPFVDFKPYPRQVELIRWFQEREEERKAMGMEVTTQGLIEKTREVGVTWLCCAYAVHGWIFRPGYRAGFGSNKLESVDRIGDHKSIFEKIRYLVKNLPEWQIPKGFSPRLHAGERLLRNPETDATITGDGGDNIGRGDRVFEYFVDEAAFLEHPDAVASALARTAAIIIWLSTPSGMGGYFYRLRHGGNVPVFTFRWKDDPRKNMLARREDGTEYYPWYEAEKQRIGDPVIVAQELDIDYTASVEGICIPAAWVRAAVDLVELVGYCPLARAEAGYDVAGERGANQNVLIVRRGPLLYPAVRWNNLDPTQSAWKAREECERQKVRILSYDAGGVGEGVKGALAATEQKLTFNPNGFLFGGEVTDTVWEDGKTSKERFVNRRAEEYWRTRVRFQRAWELRRFVESGGQDGAKHKLIDCVSIPNDPELIADLSVPRFEVTDTGKVKVMSKAAMKKIGLKSPDNADAVVLCFAEQASWAFDPEARAFLAGLGHPEVPTRRWDDLTGVLG